MPTRFSISLTLAVGMLVSLTVHAMDKTNPCPLGLGHDDGTVEKAYSPSGSAERGRLVERFTPSVYPWHYTDVCTRWLRNGSVDTIDYQVVFFDDDGDNGEPGTLLGAVRDTRSGLPAAPVAGDFSSVFVDPANVIVTGGSVYIGVEYNSGANRTIFYTGDESVATPRQVGYSWNSNSETWISFDDSAAFSSYRALMLRASGIQVSPPATPVCEGILTESDTVNLLNFNGAIGTFNVHRDGAQNFILQVTHDIANAAAVTLHTGSAGTNGAVLATAASASSPATFLLDQSQYLSYTAQDTYILVSSTENPDGHIRAQLACRNAADSDGDARLSLNEVLRVVQLFNGDHFSCAGGNPTEDGYQPNASGDHLCAPHDEDYNPQDWRISLSELLRGLQLFTLGSYESCPTSEDGFCNRP